MNAYNGYRLYTYREGDTCEGCLATDRLDFDPESGHVSHLIEIATVTCPVCLEDIRRCEDCDRANAAHANGCEPPEEEE